VKKPLLSVCLLTYNHSRYIRQAIESALEQKTTFEWQLIIADDCSTDGTKDILLDYKRKHPDRITLILQERNVGPEKNWLDLISYPKTRYLLYGEGDDYFIDPTKLQRQVDFLESHKDFALCFHPVKVTYQDGSHKDEIFPEPAMRSNKMIPSFEDLLRVNFIQTNSVMYRWRYARQDVKEFWPWGVVPGDWVLHLMHAETGKIGFIDRIMSVYRRHAGGVWWDAYADKDALWKRYGLPHLKTYVELLRRYGTTPARRAIVYESMNFELDAFTRIDQKEDSHLFRDALVAHPDEVGACVQARVAGLQRKVQKLEKDIQSLTKMHQDKDKLMRAKDEAIKESSARLSAIESTRLWKLRNKVIEVTKKK
jgi:glycosyltransferase involved in cell wall biosynthesis